MVSIAPGQAPVRGPLDHFAQGIKAGGIVEKQPADTYNRILERLKEGAYAPVRKDINTDFPLRGAVKCGDCGKALTACWSKGRRRKYAYYLCRNKACDSYGKSIPKAKIEEAFSELLQDILTCPRLSKIVRKWDHLPEAMKVGIEVMVGIIQLEKSGPK